MNIANHETLKPACGGEAGCGGGEAPATENLGMDTRSCRGGRVAAFGSGSVCPWNNPWFEWLISEI